MSRLGGVRNVCSARFCIPERRFDWLLTDAVPIPTIQWRRNIAELVCGLQGIERPAGTEHSLDFYQPRLRIGLPNTSAPLLCVAQAD